MKETLGNQLGLSYVLDPALAASEDLVTLSLNQPLSKNEFFRTLKTVLAEYGVSLQRDGSIFKAGLDEDADSDSRPLLITGGALPNIPPTHRPVFTNYALKVLRPPQIREHSPSFSQEIRYM